MTKKKPYTKSEVKSLLRVTKIALREYEKTYREILKTEDLYEIKKVLRSKGMEDGVCNYLINRITLYTDSKIIGNISYDGFRIMKKAIKGYWFPIPRYLTSQSRKLILLRINRLNKLVDYYNNLLNKSL